MSLSVNIKKKIEGFTLDVAFEADLYEFIGGSGSCSCLFFSFLPCLFTGWIYAVCFFRSTFMTRINFPIKGK